jgi:hypothetical protein
MRFSSALPLLFFGLVAPAVLAKDHTPPPASRAESFPAVEIHEAEQVAIAADPYETKEKASLFRVDYLKQGFLPVRLIVTNNSDKPLSLREARILFETAAGDRIQAALPEEVERRMAPKYDKDSDLGVPLPGPLPPLHRAPKSHDREIEADFRAYEFSALTVEPHSTVAGFLFYDVSDVKDPLQGGKLHLRKLSFDGGAELYYFEIPFELYLRAKKAHMQ